jgi:hypothetical protein
LVHDGGGDGDRRTPDRDGSPCARTCCRLTWGVATEADCSASLLRARDTDGG